MKTSNKLIIGLAGLLFAIPLTAMLLDSRNYTDQDTRITERRRTLGFNYPMNGYTGTSLAAFNSITISDGQDYYFNFTLVNDKQYGLKLPDMYKDRFTFKINALRELEITAVKKQEGNNRQYVSLMVYSPEIGKIRVVNASGLTIDGTSPYLNISAKQVGSINFGGRGEFKQIIVSAENVDNITINQDQINRFTAHLKDGNFRSNGTSFKSLSISASGATKINLDGQNPQDSTKIDSLTLHTLGAGSINITDIQMKTVSGSLSDSTVIVNMPVMYLKQLIK